MTRTEFLLTPHLTTPLFPPPPSLPPIPLLLRSALSVLLTLHRASVLYNDYKPDHFFLSPPPSSRLTLVDYNLATLLPSSLPSPSPSPSSHSTSSSPAFAASPFFAPVSAHLGHGPSLAGNAESLLYSMYHGFVRPLPWTRQEDERGSTQGGGVMELLARLVEGEEDDEWVGVDTVGDAKLRALLLARRRHSDPVFARFIPAFILARQGPEEEGAAEGGGGEEDGVTRAFDAFIRAFEEWRVDGHPTEQGVEKMEEGLGEVGVEEEGVVDARLGRVEEVRDVKGFQLHRLGFRQLVHPALPPGNECYFVPPSTSALPAMVKASSAVSFPCLCSASPPASPGDLLRPLTSSRRPLLLLLVTPSSELTASFLALAQALAALLPAFSLAEVGGLGDGWPVVCVVCGEDEYERVVRWMEGLRGRGLQMGVEWSWLRVWSVMERLLLVRLPLAAAANSHHNLR